MSVPMQTLRERLRSIGQDRLRTFWHRRVTLRRIEKWRFPYWALEPDPVSVHLVTGAADWWCAAWTLGSWFHFTKRNWRVVVHVGDALPEEAQETLALLFPSIVFIDRGRSDLELGRALESTPRARRFRMEHPVALKVFDPAHFATGPRHIVLDSDVLFFRPPEAVLEWVDQPSDACWFAQAANEGGLLSLEAARDQLGVTLWPWVDTGICLLQRAAIDAAFCERALEILPAGPPRQRTRTLLALCASRLDRGGLLPPHYAIAGKPGTPQRVIARHYTGETRSLFFSQGIARLRDVLLPRERR